MNLTAVVHSTGSWYSWCNMKIIKIIALDNNYNVINYNSETKIVAYLTIEVDSEEPTREMLVAKYNQIVANGIKPEQIKIIKNDYETN